MSALRVAMIEAGMGRRGEAMDSLHVGFAERAFWLIALPVEPLFDFLRAEPRIEQLCNGIWNRNVPKGSPVTAPSARRPPGA